MATEVLQLGIDSTGAAQGARVFERATTSVQQEAKKATSGVTGLDSGFDRLRRTALTLTRALGALGITIGAGALIRSIARATADMDTLRLSLDAVTGSSAETARQLEDLKEVAALPGLGFKEAVQGAVNLQVVGFTAKETTRILKSFGNAVALTGGGKNELDRIIFQFTQMSSLGKVTSQDLKPIIQTAPAVAKAMLEVFGTISPEKIEAMGLSFDEFTERLLGGLEKLPVASGGVRNSFENLSDATFRVSAAFGSKFVASVAPVINGLADILNAASENRAMLAKLALGVTSVAKALGVGGLALALGFATSALWGLVAGARAAVVAVGSIRVAVMGMLTSIGPAGWFLIGLGAVATAFYATSKASSDAAAKLDAYGASLSRLSKQQLMSQQAGLNLSAAYLQQQLADTPATVQKALSMGTGGGGRLITVANPAVEKLQDQLDGVIKMSVAVATAMEGIFKAPEDTTNTVVDLLATGTEKAEEFTISLRNLAGVIASRPVQLALSGGAAGGVLDDLAGRSRSRTDARSAAETARRTQFTDLGGRLTPVAIPGRAGAGIDGDSSLKQFNDTIEAVKSISSALGEMADALGKVSPALAGALRGLESLANGASRFQAGQDKGGALGALSQVSGVIGMAAGVAQLVGGFINRNDALNKERNDILNRNQETLVGMREDLKNVMNGGNIANAGPFAARLAEIMKPGGSGVDAFGAREVGGSIRGGFWSEPEIVRLQTQFGISFAQLTAIADKAGISLLDSAGNAIPRAFNQLVEAIGYTADQITRFQNDLGDIQSRQSAYNKLFDIADTPGRKLGDAMSVLSKMDQGLLDQMGLSNLNLNSETGRKVLLSGLQDIFKMIDGGTFTADMLGSFTDKNQLLDAILGAKDGLDAFKNSLNTAATDVPKAINLALYRRQFGSGPDTFAPSPYTVRDGGGPSTPPGGATYYITIQGANKSGEQLLTEVETAAQKRIGKGGHVAIGVAA